jgi:hypothetical protein
MHVVVQGLQEAMQHPMHVFWADDIHPLDTNGINWGQVMRPSDITDAYLVALAVKNQGCLVTLDQKIAVSWALMADARHLRVLV